MERVINAGKPSITPTFRKVKTALIVAAGVVAISSLALFARCKPASEENVNKAQIQNPVMAEPVQKPAEKVPSKSDVAETHRAEVLKATPQPVTAPSKVPKKIILKGKGSDEILGPTAPPEYKGSR